MKSVHVVLLRWLTLCVFIAVNILIVHGLYDQNQSIWYSTVILIIAGAYVLTVGIPLVKKRRLAKATLVVVGVTFVTAMNMTIVSYASAYKNLGIIDTSTHAPIHDASSSLYFSIVTFTTLGYGDFIPTTGARFVAASEAIVGFIFMAVLIAAFTKILAALFQETYPDQI